MKSRIRELISAPMAVALLALFVAVGGGSAMALSGKNSVSSGDIKPDAVKSSDINDGAVRPRGPRIGCDQPAGRRRP